MAKTRGGGSYQPLTRDERLTASVRNRRKKACDHTNPITEEAPLEEQQHVPVDIKTS